MKRVLQIAGTIFVVLLVIADESAFQNKVFLTLIFGSLAVLVFGSVIYKFLGRIRGIHSSE